MMPPPLPKARAARLPGQSAVDISPQLASQRRDLPGLPNANPRQDNSDARAQQSLMPRLQFGKYLQHSIRQPRQQPSRDARQTFSRSRLEPTLDRSDRHSLAHSFTQTSGSRGWHDQPLHGSNPDNGGGTLAQDPQRNCAQRALPDRTAPPLLSNRGGECSPRYGQPPRREPFAPRPRVEHSLKEIDYWCEGLPKAPFGETISHLHQLQPVGHRQIQKPLPGTPLDRHPRPARAGHNGTTTLSSEFHAQELSSEAPRPKGLAYQSAKRKTARSVPFSVAGSNAYLQRQHDVPSEINYYDPAYGTMSQQSGENASRQIDGFYMPPPSIRASTRTSPNDGGHHRLSTPAQRKVLGPPATSSVASPFFGQSSQRHSNVIQREQREQFPFAPPQSSTRGGEIDRYRTDQRGVEMLPPTSDGTRFGRSTQPGRAFFETSTNASSRPAYARGPQPVSSVSGLRASRQIGPKERMNLPFVNGSSYRDAVGGSGVVDGGAYEPRSLFSAAEPMRRSVRR